METLYQFYLENKAILLWVSAILNFLLLGFAYFNTQHHKEQLKKLQHKLDLKLSRKTSNYQSKLAQYERYLEKIDEFGKNNQTNLMATFQPVVSTYFTAMAVAKTQHDKKQALSEFTSAVFAIKDQASRDYIKLRAETKSIRLVASEAMLNALDDLEISVKESMDTASSFLQSMPQLFLSGDQQKIYSEQKQFESQCKLIQEKSTLLEKRMREDLQEI
ncbi:hypothetical protein [Marinicella rhabdoformis]|uniref:hypothetical protein n=1 Tax=Marinicella rhabdoformis TaxID=2580566 RepID=UPI0012AEC7CB|nr:hypothetical protein [Marinicella rhabdoformis]